MGKTIWLWFLVVLCGLLLAYIGYLFIANGPRAYEFDPYPWHEGKISGYLVLVITIGAGTLLVPMVRLLVRTVKRIRRRAEMAGLKREEEMEADEHI